MSDVTLRSLGNGERRQVCHHTGIAWYRIETVSNSRRCKNAGMAANQLILRVSNSRCKKFYQNETVANSPMLMQKALSCGFLCKMLVKFCNKSYLLPTYNSFTKKTAGKRFLHQHQPSHCNCVSRSLYLGLVNFRPKFGLRFRPPLPCYGNVFALFAFNAR